MTDKLVIGSRKSKLALTQSNWVADRLRQVHPQLKVEIVEITTTGDVKLNASLSEIGGKGAFTKELEDALLDRRCDLAVHSLKDLPTELPDGLRILCTPEREDTADVMIFRELRADGAESPIGAVESGSKVGTSALRRRAQLGRLRDDLEVVEFRGNVDTRLRKLREGEVAACILAVSGLNRLGLVEVVADGLLVEGMHAARLEQPEWLPAVGQGALAVEGRADDDRARELLAPLHHAGTFAETTCERAFLNTLGAGCQAPVGGLARAPAGSTLHFHGRVLSPDGKTLVEKNAVREIGDPARLGRETAEWCIQNGASALI